MSALVDPTRPPAKQAFPLLITTGTLLAVAVLLSKLAAANNAPMLTYLCMALGGSGIILTLISRGQPRPAASATVLLLYSLGAGALMALGSALGYLAVGKVGAAFIAVALAFPPLLTWFLSLLTGLETFAVSRVAGLLISLAGGALLAFGKGLDVPHAEIGGVLLACAMPVVLAVGNVYRSLFWPNGTSARQLAGLMSLCGAALTLPFAVWQEGLGAGLALWQAPLLPILCCAVVSFVFQYLTFFRLQQIAGPVYLSQTGSVAAITGTPIAIVVLGETAPDGFALAAALITIGLAIFQLNVFRKGGPS